MFDIRKEEMDEFGSLLKLIYSQARVVDLLPNVSAYAHRTDKGYRGVFVLVPKTHIHAAMILWEDSERKPRYMCGDWLLMKKQLEDYWKHRGGETLADIERQAVPIKEFEAYLLKQSSASNKP
jgi:hypothetical protein